MAKSRKPKGFVDPLDSIFGIIFGNAKTKPVRTRPTKYTGLNTSQELAKSLAEIAAKPGNYVSSGALGAVNELANQINLVQFQYDKFDDTLRKGKDSDAGRFRLRGGEVASFLTNPNKFVDSVFEKAKEERKWANYLNLGRGMDSALLATWAKKQGFKTSEALSIGMASSNWLSADQKNVVRRKFAENVVLGQVSARAALKPTEAAYLPPDLAKKIQSQLEGIKGVDIIKSKSDIANILGSVPGLASRADYSQLVDDIYDSYEKKSGDKESPHGAKWNTEGTINRDGYISSLRDNYKLRANILDLDNPQDRLEYARLRNAQNALDVIGRLKGPGFEPKSEASMAQYYKKVLEDVGKTRNSTTDPSKRAEIEKLYNRLESEYKKNFSENKFKRTALDIIVPWGNTISGNYSKFKNAMIGEVEHEIQKTKWAYDSATTTKDREILKIELELLQNKKQGLKTMSGTEWRVLLADIEGTVKTIDGTFLKGGLGAGLFNGTAYFMDAGGSTAPGVLTPIQLRNYGNYSPKFIQDALKRLDPKDRLYQIKKRDLEATAKSLQSWNGMIVSPRTDIGEGYATLAYTYYLTPASLFKTFFFNGEGFIALNQLRRMGFANQLSKTGKAQELFDKVGKGLLNNDDYKDLIKSIFELNEQGQVARINKMALASNYLDFMKAMETGKGNLGQLWNELDKFYSTDQTGGLARLVNIFGAPARSMARFNAYYQVKFKNRINTYLADKVFRKFLGDKVANKLLEMGLAKLGIRQVISMAVGEFMAGIGAAVGGPIGALAGAVLTFLLEGLIEKIIRPFIRLFFAFLWAIIIVILTLMALILMFFFGSQPLPQQHIPPTDNLECAAGNPFADLYNFQTEEEPGNLPGAPADSTCPILSPIMYCTQGDGAGVSHYHSTYHGVDIGQTGLADTVWYAPTDGTVVSFSAVNYCSDGKDYGGAMIFKDSSGIEYRLLHVKSLASGRVSKGTPVAIMQTGLQPGYCWTGAHFHLDVNAGGWQDAETWYKEKLKCNIASTGTGCG